MLELNFSTKKIIPGVLYILIQEDESKRKRLFLDMYNQEEEDWLNATDNYSTLAWARVPWLHWDKVKKEEPIEDLYYIILQRGDNKESLLSVKKYTKYGWGWTDRPILKWVLIGNPLHTASKLENNILQEIPQNIVDLFLARKMSRHFIIHAGPTNSGKTYTAFRELKKAKSGAYLAPLRLLALEKADEMNSAGVPCNLLTGEESTRVPNAKHISATVEMASSFSDEMDCAVIDEAQMVTDRSRGGAWSEAILGLRAKRIHLCLSPWAVKTVTTMIESCGDSYEVIQHDRMTPLKLETEKFVFPDDVQEHDALIVFSRRSVHLIAAELEASGISCSIIYGALPHDVRQEEARKFREGETQVVVSTDAIGMGLNLPVKRVVFIENKKFDGYSPRPLNYEEIRQIGGRAGRRGMFPVGYVNTTEEKRKPAINAALDSYEAPNGTSPVLGLPRQLLRVNGKISEVAKEWKSMTWKFGYSQANLAEFIYLAECVEQRTSNKVLAYKAAKIPFNSDNENLLDRWVEVVEWIAKGRRTELPNYCEFFNDYSRPIPNNKYLFELEQDYKIADLYYQFGRVFGVDEMKKAADEARAEISAVIIDRLKKKKNT